MCARKGPDLISHTHTCSAHAQNTRTRAEHGCLRMAPRGVISVTHSGLSQHATRNMGH